MDDDDDDAVDSDDIGCHDHDDARELSCNVTHKVRKSRSIFSRSTENGPAFP